MSQPHHHPKAVLPSTVSNLEPQNYPSHLRTNRPIWLKINKPALWAPNE